jgi:hypothetical protein
MIREDQVFIANVVVIDPMQEMMASNVINRPIGAAMELNVITKIHKYRGFHERHHFIPMAMEVHNALEHYMDRFIRDCAHFFHDRQSGGHLSLSFYIQFFKQCVSITLQQALAFVIERKIVLVGDVCYRKHNIYYYYYLTICIHKKGRG